MLLIKAMIRGMVTDAMVYKLIIENPEKDHEQDHTHCKAYTIITRVIIDVIETMITLSLIFLYA